MRGFFFHRPACRVQVTVKLSQEIREIVVIVGLLHNDPCDEVLGLSERSDILPERVGQAIPGGWLPWSTVPEHGGETQLCMKTMRQTLATPQRDDENVRLLAGLSTTNDADVRITCCLSLTIRIGEVGVLKQL